MKWTVLIIFKKIPEVKTKNTKTHLKNTNDDSKFHLEGVEIVELIRWSEPFWIESERINAAFFLFSKLLDFGLIVTASENIQRNSKELVINPAGIKWEKSHHEKQISDLVNIGKHLFSSLASQQPNAGS